MVHSFGIGNSQIQYESNTGPDPAYPERDKQDLLRQQGHDGKGERLLRAGIGRLPQAAVLHHSLGLLEVRKKNLRAALASLRRAAELAPGEPRYSYVYAVALDSAGRRREALAVVSQALRSNPANPSLSELRVQLTRAQR